MIPLVNSIIRTLDEIVEDQLGAHIEECVELGRNKSPGSDLVCRCFQCRGSAIAISTYDARVDPSFLMMDFDLRLFFAVTSANGRSPLPLFETIE